MRSSWHDFLSTTSTSPDITPCDFFLWGCVWRIMCNCPTTCQSRGLLLLLGQLFQKFWTTFGRNLTIARRQIHTCGSLICIPSCGFFMSEILHAPQLQIRSKMLCMYVIALIFTLMSVCICEMWFARGEPVSKLQGLWSYLLIFFIGACLFKANP